MLAAERTHNPRRATVRRRSYRRCANPERSDAKRSEATPTAEPAEHAATNGGQLYDAEATQGETEPQTGASAVASQWDATSGAGVPHTVGGGARLWRAYGGDGGTPPPVKRAATTIAQ